VRIPRPKSHANLFSTITCFNFGFSFDVGADYIFENEWQSSCRKKDCSQQVTSAAKEVDKKQMKIAVKGVDIFGNEAMTIVVVTQG
jgi:hypothetical protein